MQKKRVKMQGLIYELFDVQINTIFTKKKKMARSYIYCILKYDKIDLNERYV